MTTKHMLRTLTLAMVTLCAVPAFAQISSAPAAPGNRFDPRWTAYLGCWRLHQENVRALAVPVSDVMMVCVAPSSANTGVTMTTYAAGRAILTQNIVADASSQPVAEAECQGTQTSDWSRDGERLFTRVDVSCSGRPRRTVSGVTFMTQGPTWVDVQATDIDGDSQVRIRRYQRASLGNDAQAGGPAELPAELMGRARAGADALSASTMNIEDVTEASKKISAAALEAALDETGAQFNLNSRTLRQLADAGVAPEVIDLMVAQSFPDHFRVERRASMAPPVPSSASAGGTTIIYGGAPASMGYPYYDPYYSYYSYYSPFAYPYWGSNYYYSNYYYRGYPITTYVPNGGGFIDPGVGGGGRGNATSQSDSGPGMVVNGRGYTRVVTGASAPAATGDDTGATQRTPTTVSPRGVRGSSDSSSGGSVSSSGYSSGSSSTPSTPSSSGDSSAPSSGASSSGDSGGGGRTAQPR